MVGSRVAIGRKIRRPKTSTTSIRKAKAKQAKGVNCVTTVANQDIEHLNAHCRRERKEERKEVGHRKEEKEKEEKERSGNQCHTCGMPSKK